MYKREGKPEIVLVCGAIDFRCGIDRLTVRLKELGLDPFSDSLFVFCSKSKNRLKMLYWGGAGFYLILYRLEKGKFRWLQKTDIQSITYKQMEWLLDGLEMTQKNYIEECKSNTI